MRRLYLPIILAVFLFPFPTRADCGSPSGTAGAVDFDNSTRVTKICDGTTWKTIKEVDYSGTGARERLQVANDTGSCTPAKLGRLRYDGTSTWEYCNGSAWLPFESAAGSYTGGYFVLSNGTWTGNLGGRSGADAKCLTDLTNNDWKGKTDAQNRGLLDSAHVKAFLCDSTTCTNLNASTTYKFAASNDVNAGGNAFWTDASGLGPNDHNNWEALYAFNASVSYWTGRGGGTASKWPNTSYANTCTNWTMNSGASSGYGRSMMTSSSAQDNEQRWQFAFGSPCTTALKLICLVNP